MAIVITLNPELETLQRVMAVQRGQDNPHYGSFPDSGKVTVNTVPRSRTLSTWICPRWLVTIAWAIASPNPEPLEVVSPWWW